MRQNLLIQQAWGDKTVPVCESQLGLNHFSVLEALTAPSHRLHQLALDLLGIRALPLNRHSAGSHQQVFTGVVAAQNHVVDLADVHQFLPPE